MDIKSLMLRFFVIVLNIVYIPMKLFPVKKKVVFISRQSDKVTMDIGMLSEYIKENYPDVKCVVLAKTISHSIIGIFSYGIHLFAQMYHVSTSKIVVIDGYCIVVSILKHKKTTRIIQMWHALGAVKKFGYQTLDKPFGHNSKTAQIMRMHENYSYILCPSEATGEHFAKAFNANKKTLKYLGLPRIDYLVKNDENTAEQIRGYYNITGQRKIVLYVPTFRKNSKVDLDSLVKAFDFNKYILVVKLHPLDIENLAKEKINISNGVIIDDRFTSYQWMNVCDKIITDYSALGIEATLKEKPVYFYIYDYKDYVKEVGLNINIKEEMCGYAEENAVILCKKMEEKYDFDILNKFKRKYISVKLNNCTERLAEFIVGLMEDGK